jgi:hypothetical protein
MQVNKGTDGSKTGRNFDRALPRANDWDNISIGKTYEEPQGVVCIPWGTLAERVMGFMEKYEESFHD